MPFQPTSCPPVSALTLTTLIVHFFVQYTCALYAQVFCEDPSCTSVSCPCSSMSCTRIWFETSTPNYKRVFHALSSFPRVCMLGMHGNMSTIIDCQVYYTPLGLASHTVDPLIRTYMLHTAYYDMMQHNCVGQLYPCLISASTRCPGNRLQVTMPAALSSVAACQHTLSVSEPC